MQPNFCDSTWNSVLLKFPRWSWCDQASRVCRADLEMLTVYPCRTGISANWCSVGAWMLPKIMSSLLLSNHQKTLTTHGVLESSCWHFCLTPPKTESSRPLRESCPGIAGTLPVIHYSEQYVVPWGFTCQSQLSLCHGVWMQGSSLPRKEPTEHSETHLASLPSLTYSFLLQVTYFCCSRPSSHALLSSERYLMVLDSLSGTLKPIWHWSVNQPITSYS